MDSVSDSQKLVTPTSSSSATSSNPTVEEQPHRVWVQPEGFPGLPQGWVSEGELFPSTDERFSLFGCRLIDPNARTGRGLIVLHGIGEHGGRYLHFAHYLQGLVDWIYMIDHRGHGRSEGPRGDIDYFDRYAEDATQVIERLTHNYPEELHLFGHSMGGLIGLRCLQLSPHLPLASATISAPPLGVPDDVPKLKLFAGTILNKVWNTLQMHSEVHPEMVSHDPEVQKVYLTDRLNHRKITPRWFFSIKETMENARSRRSGIQVPIQFIIPLDDGVVPAEKALDFANRLQDVEKKITTFEGFYHESFNEGGVPSRPEITKDRPFGELKSWIQSHTKAQTEKN